MKKIKSLALIFGFILLFLQINSNYKYINKNHLCDLYSTIRKSRKANSFWPDIYENLKVMEDKENFTKTIDLLEELDQKLNLQTLNEINIPEKQKAIALKNLLKEEFQYKRYKSDFGEILSIKKASCLGLSKLYYLLGNAIELNVKLFTSSPSHFGNLVKLNKGTMIIDLDENYKSYTFNWNKAYQKEGSTWYQTKDTLLPELYNGIQIVKRDDMAALDNWIKGNEYVTKGNPEKAQQKYLESLKLTRDFSFIYYNLGSVAARLAKIKEISGNLKESINFFKKAIKYYNKAIKRNPKDGLAIFYRGRAKLHLSLSEEAIKDFKKAIKLNSSFKKRLSKQVRNQID